MPRSSPLRCSHDFTIGRRRLCREWLVGPSSSGGRSKESHLHAIGSTCTSPAEPGTTCLSNYLCTIWLQHRAEMLYLWRRCTRQEDDAEKAFSRASLLLYRKLPAHWERVEKQRSWILRLTFNVCMSLHRENRQRAEKSLEEAGRWPGCWRRRAGSLSNAAAPSSTSGRDILIDGRHRQARRAGDALFFLLSPRGSRGLPQGASGSPLGVSLLHPGSSGLTHGASHPTRGSGGSPLGASHRPHGAGGSTPGASAFHPGASRRDLGASPLPRGSSGLPLTIEGPRPGRARSPASAAQVPSVWKKVIS